MAALVATLIAALMGDSTDGGTDGGGYCIAALTLLIYRYLSFLYVGKLTDTKVLL